MFQQNVECFHKMWGVMEQTTLFLPIITPSKLMVCVHVSINSDNIVSAFVFESFKTRLFRRQNLRDVNACHYIWLEHQTRFITEIRL